MHIKHPVKRLAHETLSLFTTAHFADRHSAAVQVPDRNVVVGDHPGDCLVPVAALVAAAEIVYAQHIIADNVPQEDAIHLHKAHNSGSCLVRVAQLVKIGSLLVPSTVQTSTEH